MSAPVDIYLPGLVPDPGWSVIHPGETLEQRKTGQHFEVVKNHTEVALFTLTAEEIKKKVIAYETVWTIGTGETATPEKEVADEVSILY